MDSTNGDIEAPKAGMRQEGCLDSTDGDIEAPKASIDRSKFREVQFRVMLGTKKCMHIIYIISSIISLKISRLHVN